MCKFNGLKKGDCINSSIIVGARGSHLFVEKTGFLEEVDFHTIKTVMRNGMPIDQYSMADGTLAFIQGAKEKGRIFFDKIYGACELVGTLSDISCFSCPSDFGSLRIIDCSDLARTNAGDEKKEMFLFSLEKINVNISIEKTIKTGFIPLDLVETKNDGLGFVCGIFEEKVVVIPEKHKNNL